jgi:opacity protein-like surface antigen
MKRIVCCLLALGLAIPLSAGALEAQFRLIRSGLAVGPSTPVGGFGDVADPGFHAMGVLAVNVPLLPLGVRGDLMYQQLPATDRGHYRQVAGVVHARGRLPLPIVSPYVLAGMGLYHQRHPDTPLTDRDTSTNVGYSVGAGLQVPFPFLTPFVEIRFHTVPGAEGIGRTIPISVGLMF